MNDERGLPAVVETANIDSEGELRPQIRTKLFNMVIETYKDIMLNASKEADRKAAADAMAELLGKKQKHQQNTAQFHFNVPPEYLGRVFGEGLRRITARPVAEDVPFKQLQPREDIPE